VLYGLGQALVSQLLVQHSPTSLRQGLTHLMDVWLQLGQGPHSFGQLWLEAPSALLIWSSQPDAAVQFKHHLAELQTQLSNGPIDQLLIASSSVAGYLLSLSDPAASLAGCVHRAGGYLIIAPGVSDLLVRQETLHDSCNASSGQGDRCDELVLAVYGVVTSTSMQRKIGADITSLHHEQDPHALSCRTLSAAVPSTGPVYGCHQAVGAAHAVSQLTQVNDCNLCRNTSPQSAQHNAGTGTTAHVSESQPRPGLRHQCLQRLPNLPGNNTHLVPVLLLPPLPAHTIR